MKLNLRGQACQKKKADLENEKAEAFSICDLEVCPREYLPSSFAVKLLGIDPSPRLTCERRSSTWRYGSGWEARSRASSVSQHTSRRDGAEISLNFRAIRTYSRVPATSGYVGGSLFVMNFADEEGFADRKISSLPCKTAASEPSTSILIKVGKSCSVLQRPE